MPSPFQDEDLSGKKVGEYEILARIGAGGMGVVYEGVQPIIGKRVAVKVLLPQLSQDQELVDRFLAEARAVNAIRHRGIVDIFSFGTLESGANYFVMEYLDGEPFDRLIKTQAPLTPYDVLCWAEEALDALDAAHTSGIIHRDIKPSNLFLVNPGRGKAYVKLLDFGIAKLGALKGESTPQTRASVIIGTPDYMSPEQARGRNISPATDLYALGCVLHEMLTGNRLFKGENPMQTMFMHVENAPVKASHFAPNVPPELDELVLWTLEKDPANRPPSAAELKLHVEALKKIVPNERTQTTLPPRSFPRGAPVVPSDSGTATGPKLLEAPKQGTPAPRSKKYDAPPPSEPRLELGALGAEGPTRIVPAPAPTDPELPKPSLATVETEAPPSMLTLPPPETEPSEPSAKAPLLVFVALALLGGVVSVAWLKWRTSVDPVPVPPVEAPQKVQEPETPKKPEVVEAPKEEETPPVAVPVPVQQKKPELPKVKPRAITAADLDGRIAVLGKKLAAKEAKVGTPDRVLHQFLDQAKGAAAKAKTEDDRREVLKFLTEVEKQL